MRKRRWAFPAIALLVWVGLSVVALARMYSVWALVLAFWFGALLAQQRRSLQLAGRMRWFHQWGSLAFPLGATYVKWHDFQTGVLESTGLSNRIQHFTWAMSCVALYAPLLVRWTRRVPGLVGVWIAVSSVSALGNLNEIGEWNRRMGRMTDAYGDTVKDLIMNFGGSLVGALIFVLLDEKPKAYVDSPRSWVDDAAPTAVIEMSRTLR